MAKRKNLNSTKQLSPENYIRKRSRNLPIYECLITSDWQEHGLASVMMSRKHANGNISFAFYLVDLFCLGVKDSFFHFNLSPYEYEEMIASFHERSDNLLKVDYTLVHNIIYAALEFAEDYGFEPCKLFRMTTKYFLEEDDETIELMKIPCGKDDKPFYVRGVNDTDADVERIVATLNRTAGEGNFFFEDEMSDDGVLDDNDVLFNDDYSEFEDWPVKLKLERFSELAGKEIEDTDEDNFSELFALIQSLQIDFGDNEEVEEAYDKLDDWLLGVNDSEQVPDEYWGPALAHQQELTDLFYKALEPDSIENGDLHRAIQKMEKLAPESVLCKFLKLVKLSDNDDENTEYERYLKACLDEFPDLIVFKTEKIKNDVMSGIYSLINEDFTQFVNDITGGKMQLWHYEKGLILSCWGLICVAKGTISDLIAYENVFMDNGLSLEQVNYMFFAAKVKFYTDIWEKSKNNMSIR